MLAVACAGGSGCAAGSSLSEPMVDSKTEMVIEIYWVILGRAPQNLNKNWDQEVVYGIGNFRTETRESSLLYFLYYHLYGNSVVREMSRRIYLNIELGILVYTNFIL